MSFLKTIIGANALALAFSFAFIGDANAQYAGSHYQGDAHNQQRASLQTRIDVALSSAQITASQAGTLKAELNKNRDIENTSMMDGSVSYRERQEIISGLNGVESTLSTLIAQNSNSYNFGRQGFPRGSGDWRNDWSSRRTRFADEVNSLRATAETKVATAVNTKQITDPQALSVRAILSTNATKQASFMVDGKIDSTEKDDLVKGIKSAEDALSSLISINISNNSNGPISFYDKSWWNRSWNSALNSSMVARLSKLSERIERGKMSGRLTASEYTMLKADLNKLSTPNQFGFSGRHNRWNRSAFETAVNNLELRVRTELTDRENAYRGRLY
jgi:hypothetical protein